MWDMAVQQQITEYRYRAIYHVYECDIAFIQQFGGTSV